MSHLASTSPPSDTLAELCRCLLVDDDDTTQARRIAASYQHQRVAKAKRKFSAQVTTAICIRDGFIDRYNGNRLVFPGTLRLLSRLMPDELPYQKNWTMSECHSMYWDLYPTVDHLVPLARGGADVDSNCVTTSMRMNQAKAAWTVAELGWTLHAPGDIEDWDGLTRWFLEYVAKHPEHLAHQCIGRWHRAAVKALRTEAR